MPLRQLGSSGGGSAAITTATGGKADASGSCVDLVRAAYFGKDFKLGIASDSTADDLLAAATSAEWPMLTAKLLATQYPANKVQVREWSDGSQTYASPTVVNAGTSTGGTIADDTFSTAGNAVGAAADTTGTWVGSGTVTKSGGIASPAASSALSILTPTQDATVTANVLVTTAGFSGGSQTYRFMLAGTNAGLTGFGVFALLTITAANSTFLTIRKTTTAGSNIDLLATTQFNLGLNSVTAQTATITTSLSGGTFTITVVAGGTTTTQTATISTADYADMGYYAGFNTLGTVGAVTFDRLQVTTAVLAPATIDIYNCSVAGKNPDYLTSHSLSAVFPAAMDAIILSYGHNSNLTTSAFVANYSSVIDTVKAAQPTAKLYLSSQNPEGPPYDAVKVANHMARQQQLPSLALTKGIPYIPIFGAFRAQTGNGLSLVQSDGVHPTNPPSGNADDGYGSTLWARTVTGIAAASTGISQVAADARYAPVLTGSVPLVAGYFYGVQVGRSINVTPGEGIETASEFTAGRDTTLSTIGATIVTTAGSTGAVLRFGIRADNAGTPGAVLYDSGTVAATTTGDKSVNPALAITKGTRYWVSVTIQGGATTRPTMTCNYDVTNQNSGFTTLAAALSNNSAGYMASGVTGALPASPSWLGFVSGGQPIRKVIGAAT